MLITIVIKHFHDLTLPQNKSQISSLNSNTERYNVENLRWSILSHFLLFKGRITVFKCPEENHASLFVDGLNDEQW